MRFRRISIHRNDSTLRASLAPDLASCLAHGAARRLIGEAAQGAPFSGAWCVLNSSQGCLGAKAEQSRAPGKPSLTLRVASGLRQLQKDGLCAVSFASVKVDLFEFTVERQDKMLLVMQPSVIFLIVLNCVVLANRRV